jgi:Uma2 family endonuclease
MSTTAQLMTFAEFEQLPYPPAGKMELINGRLVIMPPPEDTHSIVSATIFSQLLKSGLGTKRIRGDHTGYRMGDGWVEPDASVTWPEQDRDEKYLLKAPMIAVEILSPGEDLKEKLSLYFAEGALEVWIINPRKQSMTVHMQADVVTDFTVDAEYRCDAIGVTVSLPELFG